MDSVVAAGTFDWNLAISADNDCCENGKIKVLDFGLSTLAKSKHQDGLLHITDGTSAYVAPEVNCRKGYEDSKADVWSCEVILYVLLVGKSALTRAACCERERAFVCESTINGRREDS
ncbi:hypothetical protein F0562_019490 [Nyssa sinensis]|uniref:Protein kinase domain-containing protein n=1 Tax=Nyssa sinensis TaxID=561372 RepID=A0A5J5BNC8_9ASTE|nr:hypothetical protein F0562_019490 [Nyssa sinensis]